LLEGVPLLKGQLVDAASIGVQAPKRVWLIEVNAMPVPVHPQERPELPLISSPYGARGLSLNHGIFVRSDWRRKEAIKIARKVTV
jgi:hypothetical protein